MALPPAGQAPPATPTSPFYSSAQELAYIQQKAASLGLDVQAVLAVAATEGGSLPSNIGDKGTSFGPWQLHAGGALPSTIWAKGAGYSQQWANSPAGIDYALNGIASVAKNQTGATAVNSIVTGFEKPKDPTTEISRATSIYQDGGGPSLKSNDGSIVGSINGGLLHIPGVASAEDLPGKITKPFSTIEDVFNFLTSWRFAEVLGGFALLIVGLVLLGKQFGISPPAAIPVPV